LAARCSSDGPAEDKPDPPEILPHSHARGRLYNVLVMIHPASESPPPAPPGALQQVRRYGELVKFSHSVFALPFALMATFLASRAAYHTGAAAHVYPSAVQLALIVACMVTARTAAMSFNRLADQAIDARNPRTAARPLPAGSLSRMQAIGLLAASAVGFVLACAGFWWTQHNWIPLACSLPVLGYLCFYSYTKRFTRWSHFVLGSAIAISPVAAWLAIHPASVGWPAIILMGIVTLWIGGFDIIYACQDIAFDRAAGLHSLPARLGPAKALWIARAAHAGTVALLVCLAVTAGLGGLSLAGIGIVAVLLAIENAIVRPNDFSRVNLAFFTVNGCISLLLAGLVITDILLHG
jgi:4-hydroxybenzoate polyprenyltransferase